MTMDYEQTVAALNESKTDLAAHRVTLAKVKKLLHRLKVQSFGSFKNSHINSIFCKKIFGFETQKELKDMAMKYEQTVAALEKSKVDFNAHRVTLESTRAQLKIMNGRYEDAKKSKLEAFHAKEV